MSCLSAAGSLSLYGSSHLAALPELAIVEDSLWLHLDDALMLSPC